MKEKIIPVVAIVAGLSAFALTTQYWRGRQRELQREWDRVREATQTVRVMVAARTIPSRARLVSDDLEEREFYQTDIAPDAMDRYDARMALDQGKRTLRSVAQGAQLTWSDIEGGERAVLGLSAVVTEGMRALSINVGGAAAVSGMVQPNDRVDVLGTFTFPAKDNPEEMETVTLTMLQDVTVLATGQTLAHHRQDGRRRDTSYSTVTLEVSVHEAELLTFAQQTRGQLTLSLRHPHDVRFNEEMPLVNFDHLENKLEEYNRIRQRELLGKSPTHSNR